MLCRPNGGLKAAVRAAGWGPPGRPSRTQPASPGPSQPRTYPAGRAPGAPAVVIAEGGGQRAPAGRQLRPRYCRQNPSPSLCSGAADAAAGEERAEGGDGGGVGPGLGLPTSAVGPRPPPSCGLRPHPRLRQVRAPGTNGLPGPCPRSLCAQSRGPSACSFLTQPHLFGVRKFS